jgi:hypothetical protein
MLESAMKFATIKVTDIFISNNSYIEQTRQVNPEEQSDWFINLLKMAHFFEMEDETRSFCIEQMHMTSLLIYI